jgi:hypothetical protein
MESTSLKVNRRAVQIITTMRRRDRGRAQEADQGVVRGLAINMEAKRKTDQEREQDRGRCRMIMIRSTMKEEAEKVKRAGEKFSLNF